MHCSSVFTIETNVEFCFSSSSFFLTFFLNPVWYLLSSIQAQFNDLLRLGVHIQLCTPSANKRKFERVMHEEARLRPKEFDEM